MPVLTYADLQPIVPSGPTEPAPESKTNEEDIEVVAALKSTFIADEHQQHLQQTFVNCIAKSPELIKSEASGHFVAYDSTVNELKENIIRSDTTKCPPSPMTVAATSSEQSTIEPQFDTKTRVTPKPVVQALYTMRPTAAPIVAQPQVDEEAPPDLYKTIPVRDLISTFEKQSQPQIRSNIREDKFPAQIDPLFTGPSATSTQPQSPSVAIVNRVESPISEAVVPTTTTLEPTSSVVRTSTDTLDFLAVFDDNTKNDESTTTPTTDALVNEINTFNEVAAEFCASITATKYDNDDEKGKEIPTISGRPREYIHTFIHAPLHVQRPNMLILLSEIFIKKKYFLLIVGMAFEHNDYICLFNGYK